jgi:hypothetical protein
MLCTCVCALCERCQNSQSPEWAFLPLQQFVCPAIVDSVLSQDALSCDKSTLAPWWQVFTYLNSRNVHNNSENTVMFVISLHIQL